ncbi:MAG: transposase [Sedimenticola sp.]
MTKKRRPYKTYPVDFKLEAVKMMEESDRPATEIARELGLRRNQLYKKKSMGNQWEINGKSMGSDSIGKSMGSDSIDQAFYEINNQWGQVRPIG